MKILELSTSRLATQRHSPQLSSSALVSSQHATMAVIRKWYHWFAPEDGPQERRLILKLDLLIVPYSFLLYWIKYVDQVNISPYRLR